MKRRNFIKALLAIPVVGKALAKKNPEAFYGATSLDSGKTEGEVKVYIDPSDQIDSTYIYEWSDSEGLRKSLIDSVTFSNFKS